MEGTVTIPEEEYKRLLSSESELAVLQKKMAAADVWYQALKKYYDIHSNKSFFKRLFS